MHGEITDAADRPRIQPLWTTADHVLRVLGLAGAVSLVALVAVMWRELPARVPVHFNFSGVPDRWGSPTELLFVPVIAFLLYGMLTLVSSFPHHYNYPWEITHANAERQYAIARRLLLALRALLIWMFVVLAWGTMRIATGEASALSPMFLPVLFGGVALCLGWYFSAAARAQ